MKTQKTSAFVSVSIAAALAGCTLESPRDFGQSCEKIQFIWANGDDPVTPEQNKGYKYYFNNHICPPNAPFCMTLMGGEINDEMLGDMHFCSDRRESCPSDSHSTSHPYDGSCERDTVSNCGNHDVNCEEREKGVAEAECINSPSGKACKPTSCIQTFALLDDTCRRGDQCCGSYCNDCTRLPSQPYCYTLEDMSTMACGASCPYNAELICNGVCIDATSSMAFCGSTNCDMHYCPDEPGWRSGSCIAGKCQASACATGYHLVEGDPDHCEPDTPKICGNKLRNCNEIAKATDAECVAGRCRAVECEAGTYAYDDTCIEIQVVQCGDIQCRPHQVCNPDTLTCECESGYTDCYGDCFDLTSNAFHCGGCNTICQRQIPNGQHQCVNSSCKFVCDSGYQFNETNKTCDQQTISCHTGYHANGVECEEDSIENCGKHGRSCDVENAQNSCNNGKCAFECDTGYHKDENRCAPDDITVCGGAPCNSTVIAHGTSFDCLAGVCTVKSCDSEFHVYNNTCEDDSAENCGTHDNHCSAPEHGTAICTDGSCDFTCDGDYTKSGDACIAAGSYCASNDATRCINSGTSGKMQKCTANNWTDQDACPSNHSCNSAGTACGECTDNAKQCSGRTPQICTKGAWQANGSCTDAQICKSGSCQNCDSNQHVYENKCEDDSTTNCGAHGNTCRKPANGYSDCISGVCDYFCNGNGYYFDGTNCVRDESYCDYDNTLLCENDGTTGKLYRCYDHEWEYEETCSNKYSCKRYGAECGDCINGKSRCEYTIPQTCKNGEWKDDSSCSTDCIEDSYDVTDHDDICVATSCRSGYSVGITGENCVSNSKIQYGGCESNEAATPHSTFYDISDSHWGAAAAEALLENNITSGCGTASGQPQFCPDCSIKRWEAAIFLMRAKGLSGYTPSTDSFSDVSIDMVLEKQSAATSAVAYGAIERLVQRGYIPKEMDKFKPEAALTRAEAAALLVRAFGETRTPPDTAYFYDVPTDHWAYKYVETLRNYCMITGIEDGSRYKFAPDDQMTRIQFALILARMSCYVSSCEWCI